MKDFNEGYGIRINDYGGSNRNRSRYCNWQEQVTNFLVLPFGYSALGSRQETGNRKSGGSLSQTVKFQKPKLFRSGCNRI
jgi:hypothetical protein